MVNNLWFLRKSVAKRIKIWYDKKVRGILQCVWIFIPM